MAEVYRASTLENILENGLVQVEMVEQTVVFFLFSYLHHTRYDEKRQLPGDVFPLFSVSPFSYADCMAIMAIMATGELFFVSCQM